MKNLVSLIKRRKIAILVGLVIIVVAAVIAVIAIFTPSSGTERTSPPSSVETLNGVNFKHYFVTVGSIKWHYVEAGSGDVILFLHGIPGAWYSWHRVMEPLSSKYRVIAIDLKGLGLTDAPGGSYNASTAADEIVTLMDTIHVDKFSLVTYEWGSIIGSYLAAQHPDRVSHFIRMVTPVSDKDLQQIDTLKADPGITKIALSDANGFVTRLYTGRVTSLIMANVPGPATVQTIPDADVARTIKEFSYKGIPDAIVRYYTETPTDFRTTLPQLAAKTTMPVLLLQGDADPLEPLSFYQDMAAAFPNATLQTVSKSGHVPMLEQPADVSTLIDTFVSK